MKWNRHLNLEGKHAFMSASKYSWLNKSNEEMVESYKNSFATTIGTLMHSYAESCIEYREKLRKSDAHGVKIDLLRQGIPEFAIDIRDSFPTLMSFVNDAIDYRMDQEVLLYYSDLCFGTTDAIGVEKNLLRIHDLKTGTSIAKMDQLMIYAALFFHEYAYMGYKPENMRTELRIYQMGDIIVLEPEPERIREVMDDIVEKDRVLQTLKEV